MKIWSVRRCDARESEASASCTTNRPTGKESALRARRQSSWPPASCCYEAHTKATSEVSCPGDVQRVLHIPLAKRRHQLLSHGQRRLCRLQLHEPRARCDVCGHVARASLRMLNRLIDHQTSLFGLLARYLALTATSHASASSHHARPAAADVTSWCHLLRRTSHLAESRPASPERPSPGEWIPRDDCTSLHCHPSSN